MKDTIDINNVSITLKNITFIKYCLTFFKKGCVKLLRMVTRALYVVGAVYHNIKGKRRKKERILKL